MVQEEELPLETAPRRKLFLHVIHRRQLTNDARAFQTHRAAEERVTRQPRHAGTLCRHAFKTCTQC